MGVYITGKDILSEYGWLEFELIGAVQDGLIPLDSLTGEQITRKENPCLYCDGGDRIYFPVDVHKPGPGIVILNYDDSKFQGLMSNGEYAISMFLRKCRSLNDSINDGRIYLCQGLWGKSHLAKRLCECIFLRRDVESCKQFKDHAQNLPSAQPKSLITGEEILERWQFAPFELAEIIFSQGFSPIELKTGRHLFVGAEVLTSPRVRGFIFTRLKQFNFIKSEVEAYEQAQGMKPATVPPTTMTQPGHDQQVEEPTRTFKTSKEFADYYRNIEGVKVGWIMLKIVDRWGLKNYAAAAVALGDPVPEKGSEAARSYGERFRYHTRLPD